jgi:hypothetical protein
MNLIDQNFLAQKRIQIDAHAGGHRGTERPRACTQANSPSKRKHNRPCRRSMHLRGYTNRAESTVGILAVRLTMKFPLSPSNFAPKTVVVALLIVAGAEHA